MARVNPDDLDSAVPDGVFGIVLMFLFLAGGSIALFSYIVSDETSDAGSAVVVTTANEPQLGDTPTTTTAETATTADATPATQAPLSTTEPEADPAPVFETQEPSGLFDPEDPIRRAVMKQGVVYLGGEIRSVEDSDTIATKVAQVVGPDNVYVEYRINPDAPLSNEGILEVADLVLFDSGRATLRPEFTPLLELGVALLTTNPDVTIRVVAHTDTVGSAAGNLELSQDRAEAITGFWAEAGIDPARVSAVGKGETEPIADESEPGGAQLNRRAEFVIRGLLN